MPELPEVQVLVSQLDKKITGLRICEVVLPEDGILKSPKKELENGLIGETIRSVERKAKYIRLFLSGGSSLWLHLGMTGQITVDFPPAEYSPYTRLVLRFEADKRELIFLDVRKFGRIEFSRDIPEPVNRLGPEPFQLSEDGFVRKFKVRHAKIKSLLLNQRVMAGLGNIYADESLFLAGIRPGRRAYKIKKNELGRLYQKIVIVLNEAIRAGGSSIDDFRHVNGESGRYQDLHRVYGRQGKECLLCGSLIQRIFFAGRSSHFCPKCQS